MPNWCSNYLIVLCKTEHSAELKKFIKKAGGFETEIPADKVKAEYEKQLGNVEKWREQLSKWREAKRLTPTEYFKKFHNKDIDENGNVGNSAIMSLNRTYPRPKELLITAGSIGDIGYKAMYGEYENILTYEWIPNTIKTRKQLVDFLKRRDENYIIEGQKYKDNVDKYGFTNWYDWSINNWGTKWDVEADINSESDIDICYSFDSAWSPPTKWMKKVSEKYPNLYFEIKFEEPGNDFEGTATAHNGEYSENVGKYLNRCDSCNEKDESVEYIEETGDYICSECAEENN